MGVKEKIRSLLEDYATQGILSIKEEDLIFSLDVSHGAYYTIRKILLGKNVLLPIKRGRKTVAFQINWPAAAQLFPDSLAIREMAQAQDVTTAEEILKAAREVKK